MLRRMNSNLRLIAFVIRSVEASHRAIRSQTLECPMSKTVSLPGPSKSKTIGAWSTQVLIPTHLIACRRRSRDREAVASCALSISSPR
jgi:hypothetical protein